MKIEILVIDDNAIVIKGLRSAAESRCIACQVDAEKRASAMAVLTDSKFVERSVECIANGIRWASEDGRRDTVVSGYGDRSSPLRVYDTYRCDIMEEVLNSQVLPIFKAKGYKCKVTREYFASNEKYFKVQISW